MMKSACVAVLAGILVGCGGGSSPDVQAPVEAPVAVTVVRASRASMAPETRSIDGWRDEHTIMKTDTAITVTNKETGDVRTFPTSTKVLKFLDKHVSFEVNGQAGQVYRLYQAAFNRKPDQVGLGFWINESEGGQPLIDIAGAFLTSKEFKTLYGENVPAATYVDSLYKNVLHRPGETDGFNWWTDTVAKGADRRSVLIGFSESPENQKNLMPDMIHGFDYVAFVPPDTKEICEHTPGDKPLTFNGYNVSSNEWAIVDDMGKPKPLPFQFKECAGGQNLETGIAAHWNWSLPQADWRFPESATNVLGNVKAFPEIIYGRQLYGATSSNSALPAAIKDVNLVANYDIDIETDGIDQLFLQGTYIETKDSNKWRMSVTIMLRPTKVCMDECGNPHKYVETVEIDGITYFVYVQDEYDEQEKISRYNVEMLVKESHLRGRMKMKSINDYLIKKGWLNKDHFMNSIELGTEVISGTGQVNVKHFSVGSFG
jgi:hypothetical protein